VRLATPGAVRSAAALVCAVLLVTSGAFALGPARGETLEPVPFDRTLKTGLTYVDVQRARAEGFSLPRAEVYFSEYPFVVGYYGVETAAAELAAPETRAALGDPLAVHVSDFSLAPPELDRNGFLRTESGRAAGWVRAADAWFVVDSGARVPSRAVAVPFGDRADAEAFRAAYGGRVVDWAALGERASTDGADALDRRRAHHREAVAARHAWADDVAADARGLLDRPVSVVVGEDAPTLAAALERAPPNTTVRLPAGTYPATNLSVRRPVTLRGAGTDTVLRGDGTGTVLRLEAPRAAVSSLRVEGVGPNGTRRPDFRNLTREDWSRTVRLVYGHGDAGVLLDRANGSLVHDVTIETPANGVVARFSDRAAVVDARVVGSEDPAEGAMGVVLVRSRGLVEGTRFRGGRDAVYTHRADGFVVRDSVMRGGRYGVHFMYTSRGLVADNVVRDAGTGIVIMTRPVGNAVVGNDVRDSEVGFLPVGSESYYAGNVLVDNGLGLSVSGHRSVFEGNVVAGNDVGVRAGTLFPTNWVVGNDVVDNDRAVETDRGPLRTWSHGDEGNYWGRLPVPDADADGVHDRPYRPTGPVDAALGERPAAWTVSRAPATVALRAVRTDVAGLRRAGVVDRAPRTRPVHPEVLASPNATGGAAGTAAAVPRGPPRHAGSEREAPRGRRGGVVRP
jgi:nitrous oxidase accessory protein NosD/nitrous oxide reductase accessory protein NosL